MNDSTLSHVTPQENLQVTELSEYEIFEKLSPGFYRKENNWYAIFHAAPHAVSVELIGDFTNWYENAIPLNRLPSGKFWYVKTSVGAANFDPENGQFYQFRVRYSHFGEWFYYQDPAARQLEHTDIRGRSIVTDSSYEWHDQNWRRPGWEYYSIYQLHLLRFSGRHPGLNPLQRITAEIEPYIKKTGANAIQLLPVNAFAGNVSWGYNGTFFYAIEDTYGSTDDLKGLVDTAHQNGMAVILDVVLNHIGNSDNILWMLDKDEYVSGDTAWGPMLNFGSDVTRHFLIQSILYLAEEFHIDGFRFDMTHILHQGNTWANHVRLPGRESGWNFIKELRHRVKQIDPGILLIAEELPDNWYVTKEHTTNWAGDYHGPYDSQWCDQFHDDAKDVLAGGHLDKLYNVLTYFGDNWQDSTNYTESHDEVGNEDKRIAKIGRDGRGFNMSQVAAPLTILARGIPMIFMGQEAGEWMQFGQDGQPHGGGSWWDHRLDLDEYEKEGSRQKKILNWYRRIFEIRNQHLSAFAYSDINITHIHDSNGIAAFTRDNGKYVIVLNFRATTWWHYNIGVSGFYKELANTSWPDFNIFDFAEASRQGFEHHHIHDVHIPSYGALVLERY